MTINTGKILRNVLYPFEIMRKDHRTRQYIFPALSHGKGRGLNSERRWVYTHDGS